MKLAPLLIGIPVVVAMVFYWSGLQMDTLPSSSTATFILENGTVNVYFCPQDDCENILVDFLDTATESLHCALYDIGLETVQNKLLEKQRAGVEILVVTDNEYLQKFNPSFVKADSWGLMHNKFCIVDQQKFSTGSMNPTDNDAHKNNNNLLLISSPTLAKNYEAEFQELWNGEFKKGTPVQTPAVKLGKIKIRNYFCPEDHCADHVKTELEEARHSIYFMTFAFTHESIANILLLKHLEGILVQGVMETRQISKDSQFARLQNNGIDVLKDGNPKNLHHKVFIIDNKTVITGSFNPSKGGDTRNDENLLIIEDKTIAQLFLEEFHNVEDSAVSFNVK